MAEFAFNRVYHLQVINKGLTTTTTEFNLDSLLPDGSNQQLLTTTTTTDVALAEVTFNRIVSKIKFSSVSTSASSDSQSLSIYNLDRETINAMRITGAKIVLRAGYKEQFPDILPSEFPVIYKGEIITSKVTREGNDTITELTLSSAATERKSAKVSEKFSSFSTLGYVLEQIANTVGIPVIINIGDKANKVLNKQKSWSGASLEVLERISNEYGLYTYISNEILQIVDRDDSGSVVNNPAIEVSNERIKGSLSLSTDHTKTEVDSEVVEVEFTMFLEPRVQVGSIVRVDVEGNTSDYKVETVIHRLDTHGNVWDTVVSAKGIKTKATTISPTDISDIA